MMQKISPIGRTMLESNVNRKVHKKLRREIESEIARALIYHDIIEFRLLGRDMITKDIKFPTQPNETINGGG